MNEKSVILKPGKEKAIKNRHHWIFSGAIHSLPSFSDGEILSVLSFKDEFLGSAYFNKRSSIIGRMVSFDKHSPYEAILRSVDNAINMRKSLFDDHSTNAYRLINAEGDSLPGLIVDKYADVLVLQISTMGMEKLKPLLVDKLKERLQPTSIYEKSLMPSRKEEGLLPMQGTLYGSQISEVEILENGLSFVVSISEGQKTGFFIDHREMRSWISTLAAKRSVLNCFAYTGAFSVYALAGGAHKVDSVDISEKAIDLAKKNMQINHLNSDHCQFFVDDVFQFLREKELSYDLIILDPPAFAKRQKDVVTACRGYKDINRLALQKMPKSSLLLTSSCSHYVDPTLFQKVVFQASIEANRNVRIIGNHRMAPDHPVNICHPESDYLKSLLLHVE